MDCGCSQIVSEGYVSCYLDGTVQGGFVSVLPGFGTLFADNLPNGYPDEDAIPGGVLSYYRIVRVYNKRKLSNDEIVEEVDGVTEIGSIDPVTEGVINEYGGYTITKSPGEPQISQTGENPIQDDKFYYQFLHWRWEEGAWSTAGEPPMAEIATTASGGFTGIVETRLNGALVEKTVYGPYSGTVRHNSPYTHEHLEFPSRNLSGEWDCTGIDLGHVLSVTDQATEQIVSETIVADGVAVEVPVAPLPDGDFDPNETRISSYSWGFDTRSVNHCRKLGTPEIL